MNRRKKIALAACGGLLVVLIGIQFVPVSRSNPPIEADFDGPPGVTAILVQSCYDCHSHLTQWPWYSRVAPVSWLVAHDVNHGREYLNLSRWGTLPPGEKRDLAEEMLEEVERGTMPLGIYTLMHPDAELTEAEVATLRDWVNGLGGAGARDEHAEHERGEDTGEHDHD